MNAIFVFVPEIIIFWLELNHINGIEENSRQIGSIPNVMARGMTAGELSLLS